MQGLPVQRAGSVAMRVKIMGHDSEGGRDLPGLAYAAERAGFRPCKRCRPNESGLAERQAAMVAKACRLIAEAEEMPSLEVLAKAAGMSRFHFHRTFKAHTGVTPKAYAEAQRAERVR